MLCLVGFTAMAQERIAFSTAKIKPNFKVSKSADTLFPVSVINNADMTLYNTNGGGHPCGTNELADLAKAQQFSINGTGHLLGCFVWVGAKSGSTGNVVLNVYDANGKGVNNAGNAVNYAPGKVLGSLSRSLAQINAGFEFEEGLNFFEFPTPVAVGSHFYVGLDFSKMGAFPTNKIGIVSSTNGGGMGLDLAWEKWDDETWVSMAYSWELDIDMIFIPIVEVEEFVCGVNELPFIEDFETTSTNCWTIHDLDGAGEQWGLVSEYNHTPDGKYSAVHIYGDKDYFEDGLLVSPLIYLPENENIELSFWSYNVGTEFYGENGVYISTDGEDFNEIWTFKTVEEAKWIETVLDLSEYDGDTIMIGFRYKGNYAHAWLVDDVKVEVIENDCDKPICPPSIIVCEGEAPIELTGGNPEDGIYSGKYVEDNVFYPELAGVGVHKVKYTVTDSICVTHCSFTITINPTYHEIIEAEICEGGEYEYNGVKYSEAGEYIVFEDKTILGCDSIISLHLTTTDMLYVDLFESICEGDEYYFFDDIITEAGQYSKLISGNTCDTMYYLTLEVHPSYYHTVDASICEGEEYVFNGEIYTETGEYEYKGKTEFGCDSIQTLNLIVTTCDNIAEFDGEKIVVYPNPTNDFININLDKVYSDIMISVKDITGKEVFSEKYCNVSKIEGIQINQTSGLYFVTLRSNEEVISFKVLKK